MAKAHLKSQMLSLNVNEKIDVVRLKMLLLMSLDFTRKFFSGFAIHLKKLTSVTGVSGQAYYVACMIEPMSSSSVGERVV